MKIITGVLALVIFLVVLVFVFITFGNKGSKNSSSKKISHSNVLYTLPEESEPHEGTWLEWPHEYQYGVQYRDSLEPTWVAMAKALVESEKVHIVAYDSYEKSRIKNQLKAAGVSLDNVDFKIYKNDDVWMRDNGPIYVFDKSGDLVVQDWGFNGWGGKEDHKDSDTVPVKIANDQGLKRVDLNSVMVNEGGAVEVDGNGTLMATRSSTLNKNRNPGMTQRQAEEIFNKYLGVTNFIWLEGRAGIEITDMHVDGFARFGNRKTIVTMSDESLLEWELPEKDIEILRMAKNVDGSKYDQVLLPLTMDNVSTESGKDLGYRGSYVNYYIANSVVLVPNYNDKNDEIANGIIQQLYPSRKVVGINVRNLYENGGMVHCVTQQQPKL